MPEHGQKNQGVQAAQPSPPDRAGTHDEPGFEEPVSEAGRRVPEDVYWEQYYEHPHFTYEWNNGVLEERPVSDVATTAIYFWFLQLLGAYLESHPIAEVLLLEFGLRLALPHRTVVRKPDLFVVRHDNPTPLAEADRSFRGVCDLAVEALSDSTQQEAERDTVVKKAEYEGIGVREYYILHKDEENLAFYRLNDAGAYEPIPAADGVIRSDVLPGFQFRIADLSRRPALAEMAVDPVYAHFVLPQIGAEKAELERLRAKIRELGIEV